LSNPKFKNKYKYKSNVQVIEFTRHEGLRGEDRNAFDCLMNQARQHASSCTVAPLLDPMDAVFLSILVEQQKEIYSLREALSTEGRIIISDTSKEHLQ